MRIYRLRAFDNSTDTSPTSGSADNPVRYSMRNSEVGLITNNTIIINRKRGITRNNYSQSSFGYELRVPLSTINNRSAILLIAAYPSRQRQCFRNRIANRLIPRQSPVMHTIYRKYHIGLSKLQSRVARSKARAAAFQPRLVSLAVAFGG